MDEHFDELAHLLQFRDKEADRRQKAEARKNGKLFLSQDDQEMEDWDKEMKVLSIHLLLEEYIHACLKVYTINQFFLVAHRDIYLSER